MRDVVAPKIVKIVTSNKNYGLIKSAITMVFDEIKFVNREGAFEVYYQPSNSTVRVLKGSPNKKAKSSIAASPDVSVEEVQKEVKVLIVDDSSTICNLLTKIMSLDPNIKVVGTINDPLLAEKAIQEHKPDVITLDIHMPNMNGVELLKLIQPKYKVPSIMISSISMQEGPLVLEALEAGAVDYIQKPDVANFAAVASEINNKIVSASKAKFHITTAPAPIVVTNHNVDTAKNLIVIGASTGGTKALKDVLDSLPDRIPPILIVQHISS